MHIPRTAGTSFALAAGPPKQHVPISRYAAWDRAAFCDYFKFCFVRNPWDRLLSAYSIMRAAKADTRWPNGRLWSRKHLSNYPNFESFVLALQDATVRRPIMAYSHFRPQLDWLTLPRSTKVCVDLVGRFETLEEDFSIIANRLGLREPLPIRNASEHQPYRDAYSRMMRTIVADLYAADIDAFDYSF
ncbi:MAG: sulfotransferase family 2 domain-containing protein [Sphingomicrobium sp.]